MSCFAWIPTAALVTFPTRTSSSLIQAVSLSVPRTRPQTEMLFFCETKWVKFELRANLSFNICIVAGALMYWQNCFWNCFHWIQARNVSLSAQALLAGVEPNHRTWKERNLHLNQWIIASVVCVCVCVSEIPVVSPTAVVSSTEEPAGQCTHSAPRPWAPPLYERNKNILFNISGLHF